MSRKDIEVVRAAFEAYVAGDGDRALDHFHPEGQVDLSIRGDVGVATGRQEITESTTEWVESWDDYSEELEEIRDLGGVLLVVTTQRGRGKGSGIEISNQWGFLVEVRDGLIATVTGYRDVESALGAASGWQDDR
jgi:ketosteroid isomerase-like protein